MADEIIHGIKLSEFRSKLSKGIAEVESKLDTWKNDDLATFSELLKLDNIGQAIMLYYIEHGKDPLQQLQ